MSETSFAINDLLRRKLQTSLVVGGLTLCVASTLFLLLTAGRLGFNIQLVVQGKLTAGFLAIFSPFVSLLVLLILIAGGVIISFMVFIMMSQRVRDIGLMKSAGCPNDLIFGYFFNELVIIAFLGCFSGVITGILADFCSTSLLAGSGPQILENPISFWLVILVFVLFFVLTLTLGAKPIWDAARVEPAKAISPTYYFGLSKKLGFKVISRSGFTMKMAVRSLLRHRSATIKIVICLSTVFTIVTVAVVGGLIANGTTRSWVEKSIGRNVVLIAHQEMCNQYRSLLSEFYEGNSEPQFNYTDQKYSIPGNLLSSLRQIYGNSSVDARVVLETTAREVQGYTLGETSAQTTSVGDSRRSESLIIGVEPSNVFSRWALRGRSLEEPQAFEAVVGDSLAQTMLSMPLVQSVNVFNKTFSVVGVCLDSINNGLVTYVPLDTLQNVTGIPRPNVVMVNIKASTVTEEMLNKTRDAVRLANPDFVVYELNDILDESINFLGSIWSAIMFLPLFSLVAASLCLIGYVILTMADQRQEFGILRAIGAKPNTIAGIVFGQNLIILLSSFAVGIAFGIIITLMILVEQPVVTSYTLIETVGWLLIALAVTLFSSLYPAMKFARKPVLEMMA